MMAVVSDVLVAERSVPAYAVVLAMVVGAWLVTRVSGFVILRVMRRVAKRSLHAPSNLWRSRSRRAGLETSEMTEQRRRMRIDAASRMVNHLVSVVVWVVATITLFNLLDIDAAFYLSSAGFLGAALAFGGQHKVNDYLTGLTVHFEDRYGVGDEIEFDIGWREPIHAVVDHIGLFSTRVRDANSTMHVSNAALGQVRNRSQEPAVSTITVKTGGRAPEDVAATLRSLAGSADLTQVVFLGDIASHQPTTGEIELDVQTLRPLGSRATHTLVERTEEALAEEALAAEATISPQRAVPQPAADG